jgi:CBS domain containing-hemolysin-like protein
MYVVLIFLMMLFLFFFSGIETALLTSDRINLENLSKAGSTKARRSLMILEDIENAISMTQIGINIVQIAATSFIAYTATEAFLISEPKLFLVASVQTIIFLIFCELSPKVIARAHAETFLMICSYPVIFLMFILKPAIMVTLFVSGFLKRVFNVVGSGRGIVRSREEIDILFKIGEQEGIIDEEHQAYVSEILSFKDIVAREIMTPTISIIAVEINQNMRRLADTFVKTKFSRIPVYEARVDNIIGYVFYRDFLKNKNIKKIADVMNKAYYVPATKKVFELYSEIVENLIPMIFVVDEHGAVVGMVTHEDIAEEVVGEINASEQSDEELIIELGRGRYLVSGKLDIEFFTNRFNAPIEKKGFETLAGFISYEMGKIPKKGDRLVQDKFTFIIEEATERSIDKVILQTFKREKKAR